MLEQHLQCVLQQLIFHPSYQVLTAPQQKDISIKATTFFKNIKHVNQINGQAHIYTWYIGSESEKQKESVSTPLDAVLLKERMMSSIQSFTEEIPVPAVEIDLHIEQIAAHHASLSKEEILTLQVDYFRKNLERAIAHNMEEITFIHGVGNGVLKNAVHKELSSIKTIKWFSDAQKDKYGYGATLVKIR
jgi:hypothetical protein